MNGRDPGLIKEIIDEILVGGDLQALGRRLADDPASVWIHVESAFRHGTGKARRVVQHGDTHVAPLPECTVAPFQRSEDRRVGIECVSQCSFRCSTYHYKNNVYSHYFHMYPS